MHVHFDLVEAERKIRAAREELARKNPSGNSQCATYDLVGQKGGRA